MLTLEVVLRLVIALAVVVGGLLLVRWWSLRGGPRGRGIDVVARAQLGRSTSVVVVDVAGKRYLLGTAEQSVNLIAELDAGDVALHATHLAAIFNRRVRLGIE